MCLKDPQEIDGLLRPLTCDTENVSRVGGLFIFEIFSEKGVQNGSPGSNK